MVNLRKMSVFKKLVLILISGIIFLGIYNEKLSFFTPCYEKEDISRLLTGKNLSDDDYIHIYRQTGISPGTIKKLLKKEEYDVITQLNNLYMKKPDIKKSYILFPMSVEEKNSRQLTPVADVEKGDILISFNTHTFLWRHGHCAIAVEKNTVLEHISKGHKSEITDVQKWGEYPSFIVLRHKDKRAGILAADYAAKNLSGIGYNILARKVKNNPQESKPEFSYCSHIVWQAYKAVGYDLDSNMGTFVTPENIAQSEELEVVQIFGCNGKKYENRLLK